MADAGQVPFSHRGSIQQTVRSLCYDRSWRAFSLRVVPEPVGQSGFNLGLFADFEMDNPDHVAFRLERDSGHHRKGREWREQALRRS